MWENFYEAAKSTPSPLTINYRSPVISPGCQCIQPEYFSRFGHLLVIKDTRVILYYLISRGVFEELTYTIFEQPRWRHVWNLRREYQMWTGVFRTSEVFIICFYCFKCSWQVEMGTAERAMLCTCDGDAITLRNPPSICGIWTKHVVRAWE